MGCDGSYYATGFWYFSDDDSEYVKIGQTNYHTLNLSATVLYGSDNNDLSCVGLCCIISLTN